jgi:hypothetical protein
MTFNEKVIALKEKTTNQYNDWLENQIKQNTPQQLIENSYYLAHYNEVWNFIDSIDEDEDDCCFDEEEIDKMISYDGDIMEKVWKTWLRYNHPERYNFFTYEDLVDIIRSAF